MSGEMEYLVEFVGDILYVIGGRNADNGASPFGVIANEAFKIVFTPSVQAFSSIQINYTSGVSGNVRLGIYADTPMGCSVVLDAGAVAMAAGWVSPDGLDLSLIPGTRYWSVFVQDSNMGIHYTAGNSEEHRVRSALLRLTGIWRTTVYLPERCNLLDRKYVRPEIGQTREVLIRYWCACQVQRWWGT